MSYGQVLAIAAVVFAVAFVLLMANHEGKLIRQDMAKIEAEGEKVVNYFTFEHMLDAIEWVESRGDANAIGQDGEVGAYQLKEIYLKDYYRINHTDEKHWFAGDIRLNLYRSRHITSVVTRHYAYYDFPYCHHNEAAFIEAAARSHNSPANRNNSKTDAYWSLIKTRMEDINPGYLWKE